MVDFWNKVFISAGSFMAGVIITICAAESARDQHLTKTTVIKTVTVESTAEHLTATEWSQLSNLQYEFKEMPDGHDEDGYPKGWTDRKTAELAGLQAKRLYGGDAKPIATIDVKDGHLNLTVEKR